MGERIHSSIEIELNNRNFHKVNFETDVKGDSTIGGSFLVAPMLDNLSEAQSVCSSCGVLWGEVDGVSCSGVGDILNSIATGRADTAHNFLLNAACHKNNLTSDKQSLLM